MLGTIAWTGNFRCIFEVDNVGGLRVIPGINPYASDYKLKPGKTFVTPEFIFTLSNQAPDLQAATCTTGHASISSRTERATA